MDYSIILKLTPQRRQLGDFSHVPRWDLQLRVSARRAT